MEEYKDLLHLIENDYLHFSSWPDILMNFYNSCDGKFYCSLYDHLDKYLLNKEQTEIVNIWNEFIKGIKGKLPGFPIWADEFGKNYDYSNLPKWKQNFIIKNRELYEENNIYIIISNKA